VQRLFSLICFLLTWSAIGAQNLCEFPQDQVLSKRLANYKMDVVLDHEKKLVTGTQSIEWINNSPDSVNHIEMYMYLNAFKDYNSSYLRNTGANVMGQDISDRPEDDWGYVTLNSIKTEGSDQELNKKYIQKLDNNDQDQSVIRVDLSDAVAPGETLTLVTEFVSKLPRTIARVGYAENNFHFFVHWYPKLGVYERSEEGIWGWNCHQFLQRMEFYGEFGTYEMSITTDKMMKVGGSGCRVDQVVNGDGTVTHLFRAEDVIDFAWVAYPDFEIYTDNWNGIDIELFYPIHHKRLVPRLVGAVKNSLEFMHEHVGTYPYPKITVMDPPALGMRSGFMEYPTFITGGSFYGFPKAVRSLESLIVHEFCHQYFMAIVASNEKEAPWLDEGFVTFFEDNIMEAYYGEGDNSLVDLLGYKMSNIDKSRNEYVSMHDKRSSTITQKSWLIQGDYKGLIYAKTSLILRSIKNIMGEELFYEMMKTYFQRQQFTHPRKANFVGLVRAYAQDHLDQFQSDQVSALLQSGLDETDVCDFAISNVQSSMDDNTHHYTINVEQLQDFSIPVDIRFTYADGTVKDIMWYMEDHSKSYQIKSAVALTQIEVDPNQQLLIDIDLNNNSYTVDNSPMTMFKYFSRAAYWTQNLMQTISTLM
jgi:hypothetical protein